MTHRDREFLDAFFAAVPALGPWSFAGCPTARPRLVRNARGHCPLMAFAASKGLKVEHLTSGRAGVRKSPFGPDHLANLLRIPRHLAELVTDAGDDLAVMYRGAGHEDDAERVGWLRVRLLAACGLKEPSGEGIPSCR